MPKPSFEFRPAIQGEKPSVERDEAEEKFWKEVPEVDMVVVLGEQLKEKSDGGVVPSLESKMRSIAALELLRHGKAKRILLSTGVRKEFSSGPAVAEAMKKYLLAHGAKEKDVLVETESKNTAENLENVLEILERENVRRILIETNEYHLPRARQILENILGTHNLKLDVVSFVAAEKLLRARSSHYEELISYYEAPGSLRKAPVAAVKKGMREFLRRALIYIDRDDRIAKFLADKLR